MVGCVIAIGLLTAAFPLWSQHASIRAKILAVAEGRVEEIRRQIPALLNEYPNDPGVLFLSAIVENDGPKALQLYQRIVREFPTSEWADDSQWRIVQYYALLRDTAAARAALAEYQQRYPLSEFLIHAQNLVQATVGLDPMHQRGRVTIASDSRGQAGQDPTAQPVADRYTLQIGAYSTREVAEQEAARFRERRLIVEVIEKAPSLYAVTIGDYNSREAAEKARPLVAEQCACTPFIIVKPSGSPQAKSPAKRVAK